ncbi:helix-turn-helix transcriptional regulator [Mycoplasmatota bacterium WC44]
MDNVKIGNFVKSLMKQRNMTNRDLINELEKRHISMSEANMSKLLNGKHGTDIENYMEIANIFQVSIDDILKARLDAVELDNKTDMNKKSTSRNTKKFLYNEISKIIVILYIILGFAFNWWHPGWILFMFIPLLRSYLRHLGV